MTEIEKEIIASVLFDPILKDYLKKLTSIAHTPNTLLIEDDGGSYDFGSFVRLKPGEDASAVASFLSQGIGDTFANDPLIMAFRRADDQLNLEKMRELTNAFIEQAATIRFVTR